MNRLLTVLLFVSFFTLSISARDPIIRIRSSQVVEGLDPWNGTLCIFTGSPSLGGIRFKVNDAEDMPSQLTVTATTSNPLIVPFSSRHLRISYDFNTGDGVLFINPLHEGQAIVILSVTDSDWNTTSYYIDLTVKGCTNVIRLGQSDLDVLSLNQAFTFQASNRIVSKTGADSPIIKANEDIAFIAGQSITLDAGFEVKRSGEFLATIDDCR